MSPLIKEQYKPICVSELTHMPLTNDKINKIKSDKIIDALRHYDVDGSSSQGLKNKKLALISGAGIAGLAVSFELLARGFQVVIVEKRETFSRFNVINLNVEAQAFLQKFNLLKEFEAYVAARIKEHKCIVIGKNNLRPLDPSDVSKLQFDASVSFEPKNFNKLFEKDGIYSVPIEVLQTFLAEKAKKAGVLLVNKSEVKVVDRTAAGGVSKVQIARDNNQDNTVTLQPDLFFVAEGAHSTTVDQLGMMTGNVENDCSGENWIFGNVEYSGQETFVVSIIDASQKTLQIANVIFNAKSHVINIAVTSDEVLSQDRIEESILRIAQKAFNLENIKSTPKLLSAVTQPVNVENRIASDFSVDNIFRIGDAAGHSSPLAGLGGTLGLTLVPRAVEQLLDDYEMQSEKMQENFELFSKAYVSRWIEKSQCIKKFCLDTFKKEQTSSEGSKLNEVCHEN